MIIVAVNNNISCFSELFKNTQNRECHLCFLAISDKLNISYLNEANIGNVTFHDHFLIENKYRDEYYTLSTYVFESIIESLQIKDKPKNKKENA